LAYNGDSGATYEHHYPEKTLLYQLAKKHYPDLVEQQSITRPNKRHEAGIVSFENAARDASMHHPGCNDALN
jgi:hypothetical protein